MLPRFKPTRPPPEVTVTLPSEKTLSILPFDTPTSDPERVFPVMEHPVKPRFLIEAPDGKKLKSPISSSVERSIKRLSIM